MPLLLAASLAWSVAASAVDRDCTAALARRDARVATVERAKRPRTFDGTVLPLESADADAREALASDTILAVTAADPAVRDAAAACMTRERADDEVVYAGARLYAAVADAAALDSSNDVVRRGLESQWLEMLHAAGGSLAPRARTELLALESENDALRASYLANLSAPGSVEIPARRAAGIPGELLALAERRAGGYAMPVGPQTHALLAYASVPETREAYAKADDARLAPNVALLERIVAVRDRTAHLLGYESWAAFALEDSPLGSQGNVEKFVREAAAALAPSARADVDAMQQAIRADQRDARYVLRPWDVERARYLLANGIAPSPLTFDRALSAIGASYGVAFEPRLPAAAWAPDVLAYRVVDTASGRVRGTAYFDLFRRDGKCACTGAVTIVRARAQHPAATAFIAQWEPQASDAPLAGPQLLELYAGLGNNLAALLADAPYATLNASRERADFAGDVNADVAAAPARTPLAAYDTAAALAEAAFALRAYSSGPRADTVAAWRDVASALLPDPALAAAHPPAALAALVDDGELLYAQPWNRVYAADVAAAFGSPAAPDPTAGLRFRSNVIAPARTQTLDGEMQNFLGRAPSPLPFFAEFGVSLP